ncbi:MAG: alpha/beta hydrolase [Candidatus Moduliflexus flocculans]|nr:alpha/beta hydrolase [Candidatus Moduliflexus flocculans]
MKEITTAATTDRGNLARRIGPPGSSFIPRRPPPRPRRPRAASTESTLSGALRLSTPRRGRKGRSSAKTRMEVLRASSGAVPCGSCPAPLHGGAYVYAYNDTYRRAALEIFDRTGLTVYSPDYRIAPAGPYPARASTMPSPPTAGILAADGVPGARIAPMGDSAGGGLCLSLVMRLREMAPPLPGGDRDPFRSRPT